MIAAAWVWALAGVVVLFLLGLGAAVALGAIGMPGDFLRRAGQTAGGRSDRGMAVPDEVPDRTAAETAEQADERQDA